MRIFAIADPHLSLGTPDKGMERFGTHWENHAQRIETCWREAVADADLVLIAGDISWAMQLDGARPDLEFLGSLPGTKVMIKGNHDYWWQKVGKVRSILPRRFHALEADAIEINGIVVCGTRLWDVPDVSFADLINWREAPDACDGDSTGKAETSSPDTTHVYHREVRRLHRALADADHLAGRTGAKRKIVMTHYPPCDARLTTNELTDLFEQQSVSDVIFGHLHNLVAGVSPFGEKNGVRYHLTACDWLDFRPKQIGELT